MSWNIAKPGDQINGPVAVTGNLNVDANTLFVDSANNRVGVLTASPTVPLDVIGDAKVSGNLIVDTTTLVVDAPNNRVGIGTATPSYPLDVTGLIRTSGTGYNSTGAPTVFLRNTTATTGRTFAINSFDGGGFQIFDVTASDATRFLIDSTGNVGINAASPANRLTVSGAASIGSGYATTAAPTNGLLVQGNVGIGASASLTEKLTVDGNILVQGSAGLYPRFISTVGAKSWEIGYRSGTTNYELREDGTTRFVVANGGNVGIGVTPSAGTDIRSIEIGNVGNGIGGYIGDAGVYVTTAARYNVGWKYTVSSKASTLYSCEAGAHKWFNAPSGTAGNAITFTQAMTLDASGRLLVGTASNVGTETLRVYNASATRVRIDQASNGLILGADSSGPFLDTSGSNRLAFFISGTQPLTLKTTGQINLGGLASDPASPAAGDVYYNSATNKLRCYNGSTWNDLF